jgi:hypothetical protein
MQLVAVKSLGMPQAADNTNWRGTVYGELVRRAGAQSLLPGVVTFGFGYRLWSSAHSSNSNAKLPVLSRPVQHYEGLYSMRRLHHHTRRTHHFQQKNMR